MSRFGAAVMEAASKASKQMSRVILFHRECQKGISGHALTAVAGIYVQHAVDNRRSRRTERAAGSRNAVGCREGLNGVEIPDDLAGSHIVSAQVPVHRS